MRSEAAVHIRPVVTDFERISYADRKKIQLLCCDSAVHGLRA